MTVELGGGEGTSSMPAQRNIRIIQQPLTYLLRDEFSTGPVAAVRRGVKVSVVEQVSGDEPNVYFEKEVWAGGAYIPKYPFYAKRLNRAIKAANRTLEALTSG